jgi:hypothetical protein
MSTKYMRLSRWAFLAAYAVGTACLMLAQFPKLLDDAGGGANPGHGRPAV